MRLKLSSAPLSCLRHSTLLNPNQGRVLNIRVQDQDQSVRVLSMSPESSIWDVFITSLLSKHDQNYKFTQIFHFHNIAAFAGLVPSPQIIKAQDQVIDIRVQDQAKSVLRSVSRPNSETSLRESPSLRISRPSAGVFST